MKVLHAKDDDPKEEDDYLMATSQDVSPVSKGERVVATVDVEYPSSPPQNQPRMIQPEETNLPYVAIYENIPK